MTVHKKMIEFGISFVIFLVGFISFMLIRGPIHKKASPEKTISVQDEQIIKYAHSGIKFEMVYEKERKQIALRLKTEGSYPTNRDLSILKNEVLRLTKPNSKTILKDQFGDFDSNYVFHYLEGYPVWAPYSQYSIENHFECLLFSENVDIDMKNREIVARGEKEKGSFYGYEF